MSIVVSNVTKKYDTQLALNDVSFEVKSGEVVGFLGPNGAGKSTMMKILTCFLPASSGDAFICGHNVAEESIEVRKNVGYLPEHNPLYLDMYVKEYLAFVADLHKVPNIKSRIAEMIEITGLEVEQKKKIGALSKGYRQRVGIAQAMIHDPKVLILDEPTTGLDPNQLEEIRNLIINVGKEKTILLSTHIMQEVEAICNRVIIVKKGTIVANNDTAILQKQNLNTFIITVEFDALIDQQLLLSIDGVLTAKNNQNSWTIEAAKDVRTQLFQLAVTHKLSVLTLQTNEQKLEDVFKNLTV